MGNIEATLSLKFRGLNANCVTSAARGLSVQNKRHLLSVVWGGPGRVRGYSRCCCSRPVRNRAWPSGQINTWSNIRFCSDQELYTNRKRAQRILFNFFINKSGFIVTLLHQSWLQQQSGEDSAIVRFLCADWLEGKFTLLQEQNSRDERGKKKRQPQSLMRAEICAHIHPQWVPLLTNSWSVYSKVISLFEHKWACIQT